MQLEAFAHIELQTLIDGHEGELENTVSLAYIRWLHREFCKRLPSDLLLNQDPKTGKEIEIVPGELRTGEVLVGAHLAPFPAAELPRFFKLFEERYHPGNLSAVMKVIAVAASHHRLLWIHPFYDGNGRVTRLFSHAFLKEIGIGSGLWSASRGLSRNVSNYKALLAAADGWRESDLDGRGSLTLRGLVEFCDFFLSTCIDQVKFMGALLEPAELTERVRKYCTEQIALKKLPRGSFELLRELILSGSVPRSKVPTITGYQERHSRTITASLIEMGLVRSASSRADLSLEIPHEVVEAWFPKLYPPDLALY